MAGDGGGREQEAKRQFATDMDNAGAVDPGRADVTEKADGYQRSFTLELLLSFDDVQVQVDCCMDGKTVTKHAA